MSTFMRRRRALIEGAPYNPISLFRAGLDAGFYYEFRAPLLFADAGATVPIAANGETVYRVNDRSPGANNATQSTAGSRPPYSTHRPIDEIAATKTGFFNLPDGTGGTVGEGFTITGLFTDGTYLYGVSDGRANAGDTSYQPIIMKMTFSGEKISEIDLSVLYPSDQSFQGGCYDPTDGSAWLASLTAGQVRHVRLSDGADLADGFALASVNGIAYDSTRDRLWCLAGSTLTRRAKDGTVELTETLGANVVPALINPLDHITYDAARDIVWIGGDKASDTPGALLPYHITLGIFGRPLVTFVDVLESEGVIVDGNTVYYAHDGYFHGAAAPLNKNQVQKYTVDLDGALLYRPAPGLRFNGADRVLTTAINPSAAMTLLFVGWCEKMDNETNPSKIVLGSDGSGRAYLGFASTGALGGGCGSQNLGTIIGSGGDRRRSIVVGSIRWNGSTVRLDANGQTIYSAAQSGTPNINRPIAVGAYNNNNAVYGAYFDGFVYAAMAINRELADSELAAYTRYALAKFR